MYAAPTWILPQIFTYLINSFLWHCPVSLPNLPFIFTFIYVQLRFYLFIYMLSCILHVLKFLHCTTLFKNLHNHPLACVHTSAYESHQVSFNLVVPSLFTSKDHFSSYIEVADDQLICNIALLQTLNCFYSTDESSRGKPDYALRPTG
jgi:hypothetical protein